MEWGPQQDGGLVAVGRWLANPRRRQLFRLFGYAGTGKTTLARHLAESVNGDVIFAAFTGKAASVLRASGARDAQTLHSLIYHPKGKSRERLDELRRELADVQEMINQDRLEGPPDHVDCNRKTDRLQKLQGEVRAEEKNAARPAFSLNLESKLATASLLVIDECSMVAEDMAQDILSFGVPVLVLGDPAQLPPVKGTGYFTDAEPDIMLTEIHRQARDNPIIELATRVRNGEGLALGQYGSSSVISRATPELAMAANQVIVGRNRTRTATNRRMRQLLGHDGSPFPREGEKLVCLRNDREFGLLNGTLHTSMTDSEELGGFVNLRICPEDYPDVEPQLVAAHPEHFNGDPTQIGYWNLTSAQEFTFGYALTCHKAQGSQWDDVLIIDESQMFRRPGESQKWLYTAITRAAKRVTLVRA